MKLVFIYIKLAKAALSRKIELIRELFEKH